MTSRTMAHAYAGTPKSENPVFLPGPNPMSAYASGDLHFIESKGQAIAPVVKAFFGRERLAKDRIHWMFPHDRDERVSSLLNWIESRRTDLAIFGLHKFLQSRERGALFVNADYTPPQNPEFPAFDWMTFDELQRSQDKTLQESVAFYNPGVQTILFVYLPSKTGNSVAIWRRKLPIISDVRMAMSVEIGLALAGLRRQKDYVVHVDEIPSKPTGKAAKKAEAAAKAKAKAKQEPKLGRKKNTIKRRNMSPPPGDLLKPKKKKKVRWWNPLSW
jgi:hypothetical protein